MRVVPSLNIGKDRQPGFLVGAETATTDEFTFQGRKEGLTHCVVIAISYRFHRGSHTGLLTTGAKGEIGRLELFRQLAWCTTGSHQIDHLLPKLRRIRGMCGLDPFRWVPYLLGERRSTMPPTRPPYPPEFKKQMVELVRAGRTPGELAKEFEPSDQTIRNWVVQADRDEGLREDGLTSDEREELRRLRREIKQLRIEREILSKAAAWFAQETNTIPRKPSSS